MKSFRRRDIKQKYTRTHRTQLLQKTQRNLFRSLHGEVRKRAGYLQALTMPTSKKSAMAVQSRAVANISVEKKLKASISRDHQYNKSKKELATFLRAAASTTIATALCNERQYLATLLTFSSYNSVSIAY